VHNEQDNKAKLSTDCCPIQWVWYDDNRNASDKRKRIRQYKRYYQVV